MTQIISTGQLAVFDMNDVYSSTTAPVSPIEGSLWFNTNDQKLYIYHAGQWIFSSQGLDVGGRNYLRNTSKFIDTSYWSLSMGTGVTGVFSIVSDATFGSVLQATKTADGGSWWVLADNGLTLTGGKFTVGNQYTLSFYIKNDFPLYINFMDGNGANQVISSSYQISTNALWKQFQYTFTANATGNTPELYISKNSTANGNVQITQVQLEDGIIATSYGKAPEDTEAVITTIQTTLGNMANDNIIDYNERTDIKDKIDEIIGYVISDTATSLPTTATLDSSNKGSFYQSRRSAILAGLTGNETQYTNLLTQYNNLKTYLESMSPKPWDSSVANQNQNISVTKSTWRTNWINYYNAEEDLDTLTAQQLKNNVDNMQVGGRNYLLNSNFSLYTANSNVGWDNALNGTNTINNWSGYNGGVTSPSTGYHAHLNLTKFSYPVLDMNDRNSTYGTTHRWLGSSELLSASSAFMTGMHSGDTYTISMEIYSDTVGSLINTGIYHTKKSTGTVGFWNFQWNLTTCQTANIWEKKSISFTVDSDWDLTKDSYIYLYGHYSSMECSQWIKNIKVESGQKATTWTPSPEDVQTYTDTSSQSGKDAWGKFNGSGNSLPAGTVTWGSGQTSTTVEQTALNFNNRNDRNATTPANPSINTDGSAVDHTVNKDGSIDISFEWNFTATGDAGDIDGFILYLFAGVSSAPYSFGTSVSSETTYYIAPDKRAMIIQGIPSNKYYTFGIQAYRIVDKDINSSSVLKSTIIKSTATGENPYLPSSTVAFTGDVTGTIQGTSSSTVVSQAGNALQLGSYYNNVSFDSNAGIQVYKYDSVSRINKARVLLNATDGIKVSTSTDGANYTDKFYVDTNGNVNMNGNLVAGNISGVNFTGTALTLSGMLQFPTVTNESNTTGMHGRYTFNESSSAYNAKNLDGEWYLTSSSLGFDSKVTVQSTGGSYFGTSYYGATMMKMRAYTTSDNGTYSGNYSNINNRIDISPSKFSMGQTASSSSPNWQDNISITSDGNITVIGTIKSGNIYLNGTNSLMNDTANPMFIQSANDLHLVSGAGRQIYADNTIQCAYNVYATTFYENGTALSSKYLTSLPSSASFSTVSASTSITCGNVQLNGGSSIIGSGTIYLTGSGQSLAVSSTQVYAPNIYTYTFSGGSSVFVSSGGAIGRSSSARKYKLLEQPIPDDLPSKILSLTPKTWYDKNASEAYAELLTKGVNNETITNDDEIVPYPYLERIPGLIAEDLIGVGLEQYVIYADPDADGIRSVEGILYDRLWTLLIPLVKDMKLSIDDLQNQINQLSSK